VLQSNHLATVQGCFANWAFPRKHSRTDRRCRAVSDARRSVRNHNLSDQNSVRGLPAAGRLFSLRADTAGSYEISHGDCAPSGGRSDLGAEAAQLNEKISTGLIPDDTICYVAEAFRRPRTSADWLTVDHISESSKRPGNRNGDTLCVRWSRRRAAQEPNSWDWRDWRYCKES
jgi:hypothetical protein